MIKESLRPTLLSATNTLIKNGGLCNGIYLWGYGLHRHHHGRD